MRCLFFLLFVGTAICAPSINSAPEANADTGKDKTDRWIPREPTIGWGADRHSPALRVRDRESPARDRPEWLQFKATFRAHHKYHNSTDEELHALISRLSPKGRSKSVRGVIFEESEKMVVESVVAYKRGRSSYYLGINEFADMTQDEAAKYRMSPEMVKERNEFLSNASWASEMADESFLSGKDSSFIAASCDWRTKLNMNYVKDQASCGSCYAFGSLSAVEAKLQLKTGQVIRLSEQQIVDCSYRIQGSMNGGCGGGHEVVVMDYIRSRGLVAEADYEYKSGRTQAQGACKRQQGPHKISGYKGNKVAEAVLTFGPLITSISGENRDFQMLRGGIYDNPRCPNTVDHVVSTFGYGTEGGKDYWIVRNSWGTAWGEGGYGKVRRGVNRCGIASDYAWIVEV